MTSDVTTVKDVKSEKKQRPSRPHLLLVVLVGRVVYPRVLGALPLHHQLGELLERRIILRGEPEKRAFILRNLLNEQTLSTCL